MTLPLCEPPFLAAEPARRLAWPSWHQEEGKETNDKRQQTLYSYLVSRAQLIKAAAKTK